MENDLKIKEQRLRSIISATDSAIVAFSGGVDSTLLAVVSHQELGDKSIAVTGISPSLPARQLENTKEIAAQFGLNLHLVETNELENPGYRENSPKRCYFCKHTLFSTLLNVAREVGAANIFDGSNLDDGSDYRPGMTAAQEFNVISPLAEAGMTKDDVRALSRQLDLPTWDMPAAACLSSRFPYGEEVTAEKLLQVGAAEDFIRDLGFRQFRVRHHGDVARVEISPDELQKVLSPEMFTRIGDGLKKEGYTFVAIDTHGYRSGNLNVTIPSYKEQGD